MPAPPSVAAHRSITIGESFELFANPLMQIWHPKFTKAGVKKETKKWYGRFYDHQGVRRGLPLFNDQKSSEEAGRAIERLVNYRASDTDLPIELHRFISNTLPSIRTTLAEWGIIDASKLTSLKPLEEYLVEWKQHLLSNGRGKDYVELKFTRVQRLFEACKFRMWNEISSKAVTDKLAKWRDDPEEDMGIQTSNHYLQAAKQFCKYVHTRANSAAAIPLSDLKGLPVKGNLRHDRRAMSTSEFRFLLGVLKTSRARWGISAAERSLVYRFAAGTGLRASAIAEIEVRDFGRFRNSPAVLRYAGAENKDKDERWVMFSEALWQSVKAHIKAKQPGDKAFKTPPRQHRAKFVRWDLDAARRQWIAQAKDAVERNERVQSDFLRYVDSKGKYCDFHSLRHTRGVWLVEHNGAVPHQVMEALGVHSLSLVVRYTKSGQFVNAALIERDPDLTPTLLPAPNHDENLGKAG